MVKVHKDLTGMTFGMLTVLRQVEDYISPQGKHTAQWECQCSCKNKTIIKVHQNNLTSGDSTSCGCQRHKKGVFHYNSRIENQYDLTGEYGIGYTQKGEEFWFDKEDYDLIKDYCWRYTKGYVTSTERGSKKKILLHRLLMGDIPEGYIVDHKKHPMRGENIYDNRKSNLEIKTPTQNNMNSHVSTRSSTGVTGVTYDSKVNKWQSRIGFNYKRIHLGWFDNIQDAIDARKEAEKEYYGRYSFDECNK